jgi:hypothetical protein
MKALWILTISCVLMANAVNVNAIQAAAATPTPDNGCGANSATGGCAADQTTDTKQAGQTTGTKMHHKHGSKKSSKKAKKGAADTPAPAASPSPK